MKNKLFLILIILWGVATTILSIYLWGTNERLKRINSLLLESLIASQQLTENASNAYKIFGDCITNPNTCNAQETQAQLRSLNEEKEEINLRILKIQNELGKLK